MRSARSPEQHAQRPPVAVQAWPCACSDCLAGLFGSRTGWHPAAGSLCTQLGTSPLRRRRPHRWPRGRRGTWRRWPTALRREPGARRATAPRGGGHLQHADAMCAVRRGKRRAGARPRPFPTRFPSAGARSTVPCTRSTPRTGRGHRPRSPNSSSYGSRHRPPPAPLSAARCARHAASLHSRSPRRTRSVPARPPHPSRPARAVPPWWRRRPPPRSSSPPAVVAAETTTATAPTGPRTASASAETGSTTGNNDRRESAQRPGRRLRAGA